MTGAPETDAPETGAPETANRPRLDRVGPEAAALLAALHGECLGEAWSAESVARLLSLPGSFAFVAHEPGGNGGDAVPPAGFILCLASDPAVDIAALGVVPDRRRQGLGAALVEAALVAAGAAGADALLLEVADDNDAARALYARCGFTLVARRPGYYRAPAREAGRRDALVLRRPTGAVSDLAEPPAAG